MPHNSVMYVLGM